MGEFTLPDDRLRYKFRHVRHYPNHVVRATHMQEDLARLSDMKNWHPSTHGGYTICRIIDDRGKIVGCGLSRCRSTDAFDKALGRKISFARAVRELRKDDRDGTYLEVTY